MNLLLGAAVTLLGTKAFWDLMQAIVNRRGLKAAAGQIEAKIEIDTENAKADRTTAEITQAKLLAESQVASQQVALDSWKNSYELIDRDLIRTQARYEECRSEIQEQHDIAEMLIEIFGQFVGKMRDNADSNTDMIVMKVSGPEFMALRKAISSARLRLK